jgi:hypothetical protein
MLPVSLDYQCLISPSVFSNVYLALQVNVHMKDIKYIKKYITTMVTGPIAGCSRCLRFSYHMYGLAVGKLNVYQGTNKVWSLSGNNGDTWNSVFLDIFGTVNGSVRFILFY